MSSVEMIVIAVLFVSTLLVVSKYDNSKKYKK